MCVKDVRIRGGEHSCHKRLDKTRLGEPLLPPDDTASLHSCGVGCLLDILPQHLILPTHYRSPVCIAHHMPPCEIGGGWDDPHDKEAFSIYLLNFTVGCSDLIKYVC